MTTIAKRPLNRKLAILFAILVLWLVGSIGLRLLHAHSWDFFLLRGYDVGTLGQVGGYYLARIGAQIPALAIAAIIIALSDFPRPIRTACFTAFTFCGIMTVIRLARDPWSVVPDLDQSIPILAEITQLIFMVAFVSCFTWFFIRLATWLKHEQRKRD